METGTENTAAGTPAPQDTQGNQGQSNVANQAADGVLSRYLSVAEKAFGQVGAAIKEGAHTGENAFDMAYRFAVSEIEKGQEPVDHDLLHGALTQQQLKEQKTGEE